MHVLCTFTRCWVYN